MDILQIVVTALCSVAACSGFWTFMQKRTEAKDNKTKMLIGLGHDRIVSLGVMYLHRGDWITRDEYENLHDYLYAPYKDLGGNGSAERIMKEVDKLNICAVAPYANPGGVI